MFSPTEAEAALFNLQYSMRILPQDQNSGGFFVAVFKKKGTVYFEKKKSTEDGPQNSELIEGILKEAEQKKTEEKVSDNNPNPEKKKAKMQNFKTAETFVKLTDENTLKWLKDYYGLNESVFKYFYNTQEGAKRVLLCSPKIDRFLRSDTQSKIIKVNMGVRAFERLKVNYEDKEVYRITQEGAECLFDELSETRKVKLTIAELMFITYNNTVHFSNIPESCGNIRLLTEDASRPKGFYLGYVAPGGSKKIEIIVLQKFTTTLGIMSSREHIQGLIIKYERKHPKKDEVKNENPKQPLTEEPKAET